MIIFPAIDLFEGKVVRLSEGDFARRTDYSITALDAAKKYLDAGCTHIHVVDLEGAKTGHPCHLKELEQIASLGMFVQFGGGLRSEESAERAADSGADRLMVGSLLFRDDDTPRFLAEKFGAAIMPAIDVKQKQVVTSGWLYDSGQRPVETIKKLSAVGFSVFLVTDIERDGLLMGIRDCFYEPLLSDAYEIVAAGGITTAADVAKLAELGVSGAVVGKGFYEGRITIEAALAAARR